MRVLCRVDLQSSRVKLLQSDYFFILTFTQLPTCRQHLAVCRARIHHLQGKMLLVTLDALEDSVVE